MDLGAGISMKLQLNKKYKDREGNVWEITSLNNGQTESIGPVTGARWVGKDYRTRIFRRDGSYSVPGVGQWDLVEGC